MGGSTAGHRLHTARAPLQRSGSNVVGERPANDWPGYEPSARDQQSRQGVLSLPAGNRQRGEPTLGDDGRALDRWGELEFSDPRDRAGEFSRPPVSTLYRRLRRPGGGRQRFLRYFLDEQQSGPGAFSQWRRLPTQLRLRDSPFARSRWHHAGGGVDRSFLFQDRGVNGRFRPKREPNKLNAQISNHGPDYFQPGRSFDYIPDPRLKYCGRIFRTAGSSNE